MAELITIEDKDSDQRLDRWLKQYYPALSQSMIQKWLRKGEVRVNSKRVEANHRLNANDLVRLPPQSVEFKSDIKLKPTERPLGQTEIKTMEKIVLFEDKNIMAIDKPAGLAVQGGSKTTTHLDHWLTHFEEKNGEKPKLVHRLDKETSGIMVVAKHRKAAADLGLLFRTRKVEKIYIALLKGVPEIHEGRVTAPLSKLPSYRGDEQMKVDEDDGKDAETDYTVVDYAGRAACMIALRPRTGRTHQLRVHMALMNTPIVGDKKYGDGSEADLPNFLYLHAYKLILPNKTLMAPLPPHFKEAAKHYGFDLSLLKDL